MEPITREEIFLNRVADSGGVELEPITREEHFLARAAGLDGKVLDPITRKEHFLQAIIDGGGPGYKTVQVSGTTPTITTEADTIYQCGELTNLTVTNPPATGLYAVVFTSGATPTVCAFDDIEWENDSAPSIEASKTYEINVLDNRGVWGEWNEVGS